MDAETLRRLFHYDPYTGVFTRLVARGRCAIGAVAGWSQETAPGYWCAYISIAGRSYKAHKLAWLYVHGEWPSGLLDHRDGDGLNNRIQNLRPATSSQNMANAKKPLSNTSGYKGVSWHEGAGRWRAKIKLDQKQRHLGYFDTKEAAHAAYQAAASTLFGQYARPS